MSLRHLFVDMNAFFASVEQQDHPRLRGRPVGVVPVANTRSTCCIAASYEAKARGVKTGTPVWEALQRCPGIELIPARPERYVEVHHELVRAVGRCIPITKVMSVDEMVCRLLGEEQRPEKATAIGRAIKTAIRDRFDSMRCSVGVGPSVVLAKMAADMQKPDGLTLLPREGLRERLMPLDLTDFPGIGPRMEHRFHRVGITTVAQLLDLSPAQLSHVWGSRVHGWRWWYLLRGEDVPEKPTKRRTVGHSHVLPPDLRNDEGAYGVLVRLIHKAAARLRRLNYWAGTVVLSLSFLGGTSWYETHHVGHCQDTLTLLRALAALWDLRPVGPPLQVSITLTDLVPARSATPSLFDHDRRLVDLCHVIDRVNRIFGPNAVYFGGMFASKDTAPMRIPFNSIPTPDPAVHTIGGSRYGNYASLPD